MVALPEVGQAAQACRILRLRISLSACKQGLRRGGLTTIGWAHGGAHLLVPKLGVVERFEVPQLETGMHLEVPSLGRAHL